jgi:hypothetical protein
MNRMMSNHSCLRSHLGRKNIVEKLLCVCLGVYETIDHVMWSCERYDFEKGTLRDAGQGLAGLVLVSETLQPENIEF